MKVAKGNFCGDFPPPKSTIQWSPFFSKYSGAGTQRVVQLRLRRSTDGGGYNGYDPRIYGSRAAPAPAPPAGTPGGTTARRSSDDGGGGTGGAGGPGAAS